MSLKQSIVIVNEFSVPKPGGGGSRGATPGFYITRYMSRKGAIEDITPIRLDDNDAYVRRYMMRAEATETAHSVAQVKRGIDQAQGLGGIAFGCANGSDIGDVSMSDAKVRRVSKSIQDAFVGGKTVLKTVISFEPEYLREMGVCEPDFVCRRAGDWRGNIDQMKLRLAVMQGMERMSKQFDSLAWVGVIQVDTKHVHCHVCATDMGRGRLRDDGQQKGMLAERDMADLRRGIDMGLDDMRSVQRMASAITYDRRNARCLVKRFTHELMAQRGTPQFLLACLPSDRRLWRASTNRREMRKANTIVREYVEEVLALPDSGYKDAMKSIDAYATSRASREALSAGEYRRLVSQGRERLVTDCMNGVYATLRDVSDIQMQVKTPMLDTMSIDLESAVAEAQDPMGEFCLRLRSYSSRLNHHKREHKKYHESAMAYKDSQEKGEVAPDSVALFNFYQAEEEYNAQLMAKYQYFLNFLPGEDTYKEQFEDLLERRDNVDHMRDMIHDSSMRRRSAESAEAYGHDVYGLHGGQYAVISPGVLDTRLDEMETNYRAAYEKFSEQLRDQGLCLESNEDHGLAIARKPAYDFDEVKALDLHHLGYDFAHDVGISVRNIEAFVACAHKRSRAFEQAKHYLVASEQGDYVDALPVRDIEVMDELARVYEQGLHKLESKKDSAISLGQHDSSTVSLDADFSTAMKLAVQTTVRSVVVDTAETRG